VANQASYAAAPGKRLWAAGFDALTVAIVFLVIGAAAEGVGRDLWRWSVFGLLFFSYHFSCLLLREGRTLGKTAVDICVISSAGRPLSLGQALVTRKCPLDTVLSYRRATDVRLHRHTVH